MRILVAVNEPALQTAVAAALEPLGHSLTPVLDGLQAMTEVRQRGTDLLLTDIDLPGLDGVELARLIRLASRQRMIPVLLFTSTLHPGFFKEGLEAGVLEFIPRSFDPAELGCRVDTLARLHRLQNQLVDDQARQEEELALVKHMLAQVAGTQGANGVPGFQMETLQTRRINGDACVYRESTPGVHFGMICDATGHGLMAGISTLPVVEAFLSMVARDIPLATIYLEIHRKLKLLLPTNRFVCLLLLRVDVLRGVLSVLNAGMPDVLLLKPSGAVQAFASRVLPAGIAGVDPGVAVTEADLGTGDRIFAFSDGLGDLVAPEEIVNRYLKEPSHLPHQEHCAAIRELARATSRREEHGDDLSWALWEVPAPATPTRSGGFPPQEKLVSGFQASFQLDPRFHAIRDVLPHVLSLILGFQVSPADTHIFAMLLTEALSNAVDHGLLGLDSAVKARGFEAYDLQRNLALACLKSGDVRFTLTLLHEEGEWPRPIRRIQAEVADTGPGFDWRPYLVETPGENLRPYGRGIALLSALGKNLEFNETGNRLSFCLDCT